MHLSLGFPQELLSGPHVQVLLDHGELRIRKGQRDKSEIFFITQSRLDGTCKNRKFSLYLHLIWIWSTDQVALNFPFTCSFSVFSGLLCVTVFSETVQARIFIPDLPINNGFSE